ncbi:MAG: ChaN family lipoprotein [Gammaproteobacteria bacterium]|nr:ChaN family lipoprotein [Gammaproteobacteria bacterium]
MKSLAELRLASLLMVFLLAANPSGVVHAGDAAPMRFADHPLSGRIFDVKRDAFVDEPELVERLRGIRLVLVGEKHDNDEHHFIERRLLGRLVDNRTRVVFEMMDESQQPLIETLERGDAMEVIRDKLSWTDRWPWPDYGPLIRTVLERGGTIVAGNIDRERIGTLYSGETGWLDDDPRFASHDVLGHAGREAFRERLYVSHCEVMPRESLDPMITIQTARDASMAHAMLGNGDAGPPTRSILVAGGFHTRRDLGVPAHIGFLDSKAETAILLLREAEPGLSMPGDYDEVSTASADYLWFTPAAPEKDYCADLVQGE